MKPTLRNPVLLVTTVLVFSQGAASCQAQRQIGRARIPFGFEWGGVHLAAGQYVLRLNGAVVTINDGRKSVMAIPMAMEMSRTGAPAQIIFHCIAGQCFLRDISMPGSGYHLAFAPAKAERGVVPRQVAGASEPETGDDGVVVSLE